MTAIGIGAEAYALALQPDGRLVAAGSSWDADQSFFALARYNPNGSLDTSFSGTGKITTAIGSGASALVLQPDGKLVAAGGSYSADFALARYNPNGSLDTSFNGTGTVTTAIGSAEDFAYALALQPDGKLVAAGLSWNCCNPHFALARYLGKSMCVVPRVTGKTLAAAKRAIMKAHCATGQVTKAFSRKVKKGRVISEKPAPGKKLAAGSKVKLVVSRGQKA